MEQQVFSDQALLKYESHIRHGQHLTLGAAFFTICHFPSFMFIFQEASNLKCRKCIIYL